MRKNAKLYLLSWALCFMWTKNYCLHKKLKFWMKGPDWKDQKSSSKYNPFMFSLRIIYTLCLMDKKENRLREPTNRLILILEETNRVHDRKPSLIISNGNQNCPMANCPDCPGTVRISELGLPRRPDGTSIFRFERRFPTEIFSLLYMGD